MPYSFDTDQKASTMEWHYEVAWISIESLWACMLCMLIRPHDCNQPIEISDTAVPMWLATSISLLEGCQKAVGRCEKAVVCYKDATREVWGGTLNWINSRSSHSSLASGRAIDIQSSTLLCSLILSNLPTGYIWGNLVNHWTTEFVVTNKILHNTSKECFETLFVPVCRYNW